MKIELKLLVTSILLSFFTLGFSQNELTFDLEYKINTVYPPLSISPSELIDISSITDINRFYKTDWVKKYFRDSYALDFMEGTHIIQKNNIVNGLKRTDYVANW